MYIRVTLLVLSPPTPHPSSCPSPAAHRHPGPRSPDGPPACWHSPSAQPAQPLEGVEDDSLVILPLGPGHGPGHPLHLLDPHRGDPTHIVDGHRNELDTIGPTLVTMVLLLLLLVLLYLVPELRFL